MAALSLNFPTNRLQHSQIQRGTASGRTECTRTSEFHALYRTAPSTVLAASSKSDTQRVRGNYAGSCASDQTQSLSVTLVFLNRRRRFGELGSQLVLRQACEPPDPPPEWRSNSARSACWCRSDTVRRRERAGAHSLAQVVVPDREHRHAAGSCSLSRPPRPPGESVGHYGNLLSTTARTGSVS
jgi:hypothetical protein